MLVRLIIRAAAPLLLLFAFGVPLLFAAGSEAPPADAGSPAGTSALERFTTVQRGWMLEIALTTGKQFDPGRHAAAGKLGDDQVCVEVVQERVRRAACFARARGGELEIVIRRLDRRGRLRGGQAAVDGKIRQSGRTLRARLPFAALGLRPGRYAIRAVATRAGEGCEAVGEGRRCADAVPPRGMRMKQLRPPRLAGCEAAGPAGPVSRGEGSGRRVALTFDDGPSAQTIAVLDILRAHGARATFFVIGSQVAGRAAVLERMLTEGHAIANHTWGHDRLASAASLDATSRAIREATGFEPCTFRPPAGVLDERLVADAHALGMTTVMWDVDPHDWLNPSPKEIEARVAAGVRPGSIVLLHDGGGERDATIAALPGILTMLDRRGYRAVTVPQLLGQPAEWGS